MNKYLTLLLVFTSLSSIAQTIYYTPDGKAIVSKSEIISRAEAMQEQISKISKNPKFVNVSIVDSIKTKDSIVYYVHFLVESKKDGNWLRKGPLAGYLNQKFLDFKLRNLEDQEIGLQSFQGKPTLINFWFTNCPPCIKEIPLFNSLKEKYGDEFNFIAITFDTKEKVKGFLLKKPFDFDQLVDAKTYIDLLDIRMYPVTAFLDSKGHLKFADGSYKLETDQDFIDIQKKIIQRLDSLK